MILFTNQNLLNMYLFKVEINYYCKAIKSKIFWDNWISSMNFIFAWMGETFKFLDMVKFKFFPGKKWVNVVAPSLATSMKQTFCDELQNYKYSVFTFAEYSTCLNIKYSTCLNVLVLYTINENWNSVTNNKGECIRNVFFSSSLTK